MKKLLISALIVFLSAFGARSQETEEVHAQSEAVHTKTSTAVHIKTNILGLAAGIANAAVEIDFAKHWSVTLPVYFCAWDHFKSTIKFRTASIQPEFRFWINDKHNGFYTGIHFGAGHYNIAADGDYRYQDHNMKTPSLGGGLSIGYRLPISRNNRWNMEFAVGAGAYLSHYDKFYNTPVTSNGLMISDYRFIYRGIDQAAISFSYMFGGKTKEVKE